MARPIKEGMDYFPHDTDAVSDEKVEALRALYGNDGYAFFFILLERIYRTPQAEIDVSDAETTQILARKVGISDQKFKEILATALKWGCFDKIAYQDKGILTSNGIKKRAQVVIEKRESMRDKYLKSKLEGVSSPISDAETTPETPQSKVKESKGKESKVNKTIYIPYPEFPNVNKMTKEEHQKLIDLFGEAGTRDRVENLSLYIASKGDKYKNHYATILAWEKRDEKGGQDGAHRGHSATRKLPTTYRTPKEIFGNDNG